jgi:hypothetical protein
MDISRRGLLTGAGAIGGAAVLGTAGAAGAAPAGADATVEPNATPTGITSISSAPEPGVSYRFASWLETSPVNDFAHGRSFSAHGVFNGSGNDFLGTTFELPPGAVLHDVEVYFSAQVNTIVNIATWSSGQPNLANVIVGPTQIGPFPDANLHAKKIAVPAAVNGPFPHGTKLAVYLATITTGTIGLNGFRLGLKNAPLSPVLLAAPTRIYDSRDHSPLVAGRTRAISLASHLPTGANGAMYTLSILNTHGDGSLHVGAAGSSLAAVGIQWWAAGQRLSNSITSAVSGSRAIGVHSTAGSGKTDFIIDLTGYLV